MSERMYREYQLKILGAGFSLLLMIVSFFLIRTFNTLDKTSDAVNALSTSFEVFKATQKMKNEKLDAMDKTLQSTQAQVKEANNKVDKILKNQ